MDLAEVLARRRSVRVFHPDPIRATDLEPIVEAALTAPTAGNLQAFNVVVVQRREVRAALASAAFEQEALATAPVVLVFCAATRLSEGRYGERGRTLYCVQDATIACTLAWLAAVERGLAGVWIGAFDEHKASVALGLAPDLRPVALLPLGRAAETPAAPAHRPREQMVSIS